ncbi:MAG: isoprenyl transferase [Gammaproteobacteria bacterium]|nr:MAG: isoprenyl transferase [Gammaproteobacteria bacterium]
MNMSVSIKQEEGMHNSAVLPQHIAVIMDGNGRWARKRGLPRIAGHKKGVDMVRTMIASCSEKKIPYLTLFAFSSENWRRPEKEVKLLMDLFVQAIDGEIKKLHKNNIRFQVIGDKIRFGDKLINQIEQAEALTRNNDGMLLNIAANYGGRWDLIQAAKSLAEDVVSNKVSVEKINEDLFSSYLCLSDCPEPDLFIRTGGEHRISNFLLWQLAYTELYFTDTLWPEFSKEEFEVALHSFTKRQRRFGQTEEQVEATRHA